MRSWRGFAVFLLLAMLILGTIGPAQVVAQDEADAADLAASVLRPADLPEVGFQFAAGSPFLSEDFFGNTDVTGYSSMLALLSDRADPESSYLATASTVIASATDDASAEDLLHDYRIEVGLKEQGDGVLGDVEGAQSVIARTSGDYLVIVLYEERGASTQQNTEDWSLEALTDLSGLVVDRLESGERGTASSALGLVSEQDDGPGWNLYYRVVDGEPVPVLGEPDANEAIDLVPGIETMVANDYRFRISNGDHIVRMTTVVFGDEAEAEAYAADLPDFARPTSPGIAEYTVDGEVAGGYRIERGDADIRGDAASALRASWQTGTEVVVVEWFVSGSAVTNDEAITMLIDAQVSCLEAAPAPCEAMEFDSLIGPEVGEGTPGVSADTERIVSNENGWSVDLPTEDGWQVAQTEDEVRGSDFVELQSGRSLARFETVTNRGADESSCVIGELDLLQELEEHSLITLGSDDPDERKAGLEDGHGWAIYTVEPLEDVRADQEYTIRFDCYTLVPGETSLVMTQIAPRDLWTEERAKGERLREGIQLPEVRQHVQAPLVAERLEFGRTPTVINHRIWIELAA